MSQSHTPLPTKITVSISSAGETERMQKFKIKLFE